MDRRFLLSVLVVVGAAFVAHASGLGGGFVYDDHRFIEENASLSPITPLVYFTDASTASATEGVRPDVYRPLRTLSFAVDRALFGTSPLWWHVENLLLHVLASLLVLRLLWPLFGGRLLAATAGALLFAVHPAAVEVVAWVSSRGDLLAVVLMLAALLAFERPGARRTVLGAALGALAILAKESALVLPALLLLRDLALPRDRAVPRWTTWLRVGVLAAVIVGYFVLRLLVLPGLAQVEGFPGGSRLAALRAFLAGTGWYAKDLVWPTGFPFDFQLPVPLSFLDPAVVVGLGLLATLLLAGAYGLLRGPRWLAFAALGGLACLVPVSNVLVPLKTVVAERFLYPVLVCLAAGFAGAAWALARRAPPVAWAAVLLVVAVLIPSTWSRTRPWHDELALWTAVLEDQPSDMRAYEGIAFESMRRGRMRDAEVAWRSYLEFNPIDGKGWFLLGNTLGVTAEALRPAHPQPGVTISSQGRQRARVGQLTAYAHALQAWSRVGLAEGRGSPAMLRETYERTIEAAWDLGDLAKAEQANDRLIALAGIDPTDTDAVLTKAPFRRRQTRYDLALRAATADEPPGLDEEGRRRMLAQRAALLEDVGLSARLTREQVLERLLPVYEKLATEPEAGVDTSLQVVAVLQRLHRDGEAKAWIERLHRRYPDLPLPGAGS